METYPLLAFLGLVALGSYIQTVSGFAIALIIAGGATALGLASVAFTANVISFVALANTAVAVHSRHSHIDLKILASASIGVLIVSGVGLTLLNHLSSSSIDLLEILLGVVILASGAMLMFRPHPLKQVSSNYAHLLAGGFAGLLSGMFGTGGPPLVIHLYRQPLPFPVVRTTLLAILGIMPVIRIVLEAFNGNLTEDVLELSLYSVPVSVAATVFARRFPPPLSDLAMRRLAFALLCLLGLSLIVSKI